MSLKCTGSAKETKGIFISLSKKPIVTFDQVEQSVNPPPYAEFVSTGELITESGASLTAVTRSVNGLTSNKNLKSELIKDKIKREL